MSTQDVATLLVVNLHSDRYGKGDYMVNAFSMTLIAGDENGSVYAELELGPEIENVWNARIVKFIGSYFGAAVSLVAHNLTDVVRYFQQSALDVADRLARSPRIDLDGMMFLANGLDELRDHIPARDVGTARDTFENYMFFTEVFSAAAERPPLALYEMQIYNHRSDEPVTRLRDLTHLSN